MGAYMVARRQGWFRKKDAIWTREILEDPGTYTLEERRVGICCQDLI
jgi:hypothetical protein